MEAGAFTRKSAVLALKNMIAADHRFNQALLKLATARALVPASLSSGTPKSSPRPQRRDNSPVYLTWPPKAAADYYSPRRHETSTGHAGVIARETLGR